MKAPDKSPRAALSGNGEKYMPRFGLRRLTLAVLGVTIAGVASSAVWVAYNKGMVAGTETAAPLIRSTLEETKRRPAEPGGMQVPNRDKLVFNRIAPDAGEVRLERLLPPPEAPLPRPSNANVTAAETSVRPVKSQPPAAAEPGKIEAARDLPKNPLVATAPPPVVSPPAAEAPEQAIVPPVAELAEVEPATEPPAKAWRVQIAAMRTVPAAEQAWKILASKYNDLLGELRLNVEEITLGGRGTFYRVQAGPLIGKKEAGALCTALKIREQDCLVVRP